MIGKLGGQNAHNTPPCSSQAPGPADRPSSRSAQLRGSLILHNGGVASHTCRHATLYDATSTTDCARVSPGVNRFRQVRKIRLGNQSTHHFVARLPYLTSQRTLRRQAVFRANRQGIGAVRLPRIYCGLSISRASSKCHLPYLLYFFFEKRPPRLNISKSIASSSMHDLNTGPGLYLVAAHASPSQIAPVSSCPGARQRNQAHARHLPTSYCEGPLFV
ncbi:hypothetical protein PpBr36_00797 [Pyricularia pennisetigena]|uniref:hypothetical protein n=1 Tax=Pyricularia pennisetigena TaxID=1578925 RepID=UPI00114D8939|nr:hypothetical protein PpBr36_00797 [Pyricularia pennisetigena]TLS29330.1 hypothetical protein PpBr36_00797 [Pyricularia pennisetigena]